MRIMLFMYMHIYLFRTLTILYILCHYYIAIALIARSVVPSLRAYRILHIISASAHRIYASSPLRWNICAYAVCAT